MCHQRKKKLSFYWEERPRNAEGGRKKVRVPPVIAAGGRKNFLSDRCIGDQVCSLGSSPTGKGGPLYC